MMHLLDLPSEVLAEVSTFCFGSLKNLRLTHSRISQASTPALFRSVTIVPHATSLTNLLTLSQSPLARHVHDIVYDVRMLSSILDIKMVFDANKSGHVGANADMSRHKVFARLDEYAKQAFTSVEGTEVELRTLLELLPRLPNLEHITMTSGSLCELPHFLRELKGPLSITSDYYFQVSTHSGHHAHSVMLCLGALDLRVPRLSFVGVDWSEIMLLGELRSPLRYFDMLRRVFASLPRGALPAPMRSLLDTTGEDTRGLNEDLRSICARVLDNVQHLTLSLATARSEGRLFLPTGPSWPLSSACVCAWLYWFVDCMRSISPVGPRNLRSLTLSSLVLDQESLRFVLDGCRDTLLHLSIGDARFYTGSDLPAQEQGTVDESCLVEILDMIPRHMRCLQSVKLFGRFYNGGSQDWVLNTRSKETLRTDVEYWLVNGGTCPLDSERLAGELQGTRAGDASFKIFRRTLADGADDEVDYEFPPTSENELIGAW